MPSYAVIGATGRVGQSILETLLQSPDNEIHAYVRSEPKLVSLLPTLTINPQPNIKIYEGALTDTSLLSTCLSSPAAIFLTTAPNGNQPKCTIAADTARLVVSALASLHSSSQPSKSKHDLPRIILLSSSSTDHDLMQSVPWILRELLYCANYHIYEDLKRAEEYLLTRGDFVSSVFIKPGALSVDEARGYSLSVKEAKSPVSYLDLAAGMVELGGMGRAEFEGRGVAVNAMGRVGFPLAKGLVVYLFPWCYSWLN